MPGGDQGRAYDARGNVRPADKRFLGKGRRVPAKKAESAPQQQDKKGKD